MIAYKRNRALKTLEKKGDVLEMHFLTGSGRTHVSAKNCRVFRAYTASNAIANWKMLGISY